MKKKILTLCLVLCLAATAVIGGTLAYFTDTEKATNVMVNGKVDIDLEEHMLTDDGWKPFEDEKMVLFPMEDAKGNALYNKLVTVYNDGPSDAYIRTIMFIEHDALVDDPNAEEPAIRVHYGYSSQVEVTKEVQQLNVGGTDYDVIIFDQADTSKVVKKGESIQSLQSIWYDKAVTDEMLAGNEDGKLDVLILAQGVQTEGFDSYDAAMASFGEINAENLAKWFNGATEASINDHSTHNN